MKITKSSLKQFIKEELNKMLNEVGQYGIHMPGGSTRSVADPHTAALNSVEDHVSRNYPEDLDLIRLIQKAQELTAAFENSLQPEEL